MSRKPPSPFPPGKRFPKGVESVGVASGGRKTYVLNPVQAQIQWPGVSVDSSSFENLSVSQKFYEQAIAFLRAAKVLCEAAGVAGQLGKRISWPQGSVCLYCLNLATELFLKGCISRGSDEAAPATHDIKKLLRQYKDILPGSEFQFQVPMLWNLNASEIEHALGSKIFSPVDKMPDQLYRYGVGKDGSGSGLTHVFAPGSIVNRIAHFERVWQRAWNEVCKSHG
jgi:HEPN domain-containing protein